LRPKKLDRATVTGPMLVHLAQEYCKAINDGGMPAIKSAWTYAVQEQLRSSCREAVQLYRARMNDKAMHSLPMYEDELRAVHRAAKAEALELFFGPGFREDDTECRDYRAELNRRIRQLYDHVKGLNSGHSRAQCEEIAEELYRKHIEVKLNVRGSYKDTTELMADWEEVRRIFHERTSGPGQAEVMSSVILTRMTESVNRVCDQKKLDEKAHERSCTLGAIYDGAVAYFTGAAAKVKESAAEDEQC